jgi:anaerobic ribonucleoside-triphosphate reductase activating protein
VNFMIEVEPTVMWIGHRSEHSAIYGPGIRYVIWTQGCNLACEGCWNKQFWPKGGTPATITDLVKEIRQVKGIEGITILGGEPLQQANATLELIRSVKALGLTVFMYTGYEPEEFDETMQACFDSSDIVVTGRYIESQRNVVLRWRGSTNQVLHCPTGRYSLSELNEQNEVEIVVNEDGTIELYGYPDSEIRQWIENQSVA